MTKAAQWIPILVPKDVAEKLFKQAVLPKGKETANFRRIMKKLHQTRRKLLKENPHAYIDYTA